MNTGLLVVDVQPEYDAFCKHITQRVARRINNTVKPITIMWVGQGISSDTEDSVREYLIDHGARRRRLAEACFIEKDYGFFRDWMDCEVPKELIIKAGKSMLREGVRSSSDLDLEALFGKRHSELPDWGGLSLPSFDLAPLQAVDQLETCGGGDEECLAEMELWLDMTGKPYKRLSSLVY